MGESREYKATNLVTEHGTSHCDIECPFCGDTVVAYLWSLAGCGKRCCTCKDVIHYTTYSRKGGYGPSDS